MALAGVATETEVVSYAALAVLIVAAAALSVSLFQRQE